VEAVKTQESNGLARDAILPSWLRTASLRKPLGVRLLPDKAGEETPRGDRRVTSPEEFAGRKKL
jgi:hypothetical protein